MIRILNIIKIAWLGFWVALYTLILSPPIIISALLSRTGNLAFTLTRLWAWLMFKTAGVRTGIRGREKIKKGQSYVIISNHQSHFDALILVIKLGIQFRWIAKKELLKIPLFGYALYAAKNIFIDRSNREKAIKSIHRGMDRLAKGVSVLFFAEGSRSPDGALQKFKKGGFAIAIERNLPLLPVTVNGSRKVLPKGEVVFHSGKIEVAVGDPIKTNDFTIDRIEELVKITSDMVFSNLNPDYP